MDDKEEALIDLGCKCKDDIAKAHRSCIEAWFLTVGLNKCEICQEIAVNVSLPESQPSATNIPRDSQRFSPIRVAFSVLTGGVLLEVLISITLGAAGLLVIIVIGVILLIELGTVCRLAREFYHERRSMGEVHRAMV
ncbi:hypothetical protein LINGRAHAP2_LOCUS35955 [Linum grandiflorum]